ncbi:MAG: RDD family protein [Leptospiraceae bacterium]
MPLDNSRSVSIPEFWEINYRTAGPVARFLALLLDMIILYLMLLIILLLLTFTFSVAGFSGMSEWGKVSVFIQFMLFFVVFWGYFMIWEYFSRGRTPGKMIMGLRVISLRGTGLNASHSVIRNMVRIGDMYPFLFQFGFFFIPSYFVAAFFLFLTGRSFRRLGDIAAGTLVIRDQRGTRASRRMLESARTDASGIRPMASLSPNLMRAIHEYAVRRNTMNPIIRKDLADRFAPRIAEYFQVQREFQSNEELMLAIYTYLFESNNQISVDKSISI